MSSSKVMAILLIGNTEENNVISFDEETGAFWEDFISLGVVGLVNPDD